MDVDRSFEDHDIIAESGVDQFVAIEDASGLLGQSQQQIELAFGQLQRLISGGDSMPSAVDDDPLADDHIPLIGLIIAATEQSGKQEIREGASARACKVHRSR